VKQLKSADRRLRHGPLRYVGFLFSVGTAKVAGVLISSLTFPYVVRKLGVEMYGLWSYIVAICAFLDILADPGLTTYMTQQVAARRQEGLERMADFFVLRLLTAILTVAVVLVIAHFESRPDMRRLLRIYGIGILFVNITSADPFLASLEMFHARSLLIVAQQAIYSLGVFALVRAPRDVVWLAMSILVSSFLAGCAGWIVIHHNGFRLSRTVKPGRWRGILVPGLHYAAATLMSSTYHRLGHLVVRWFLGNFALGLYAAAIRLVDLLRSFVTTILYVLLPKLALSAKSEAELVRVARYAVATVALISFPMAAGLLTTSQLIVPWLLGPKYSGDVPLLIWISPYLVTAPAASLWAGTILYAMGRHRAYLAATGGGAVAGCLLYATLIPLRGLQGAGIAFVLAELVVALIGYSVLPKALRSLWRNSLVGVALVSSGLMALAVWILGSRIHQALAVVLGGFLIYVVSVTLLGGKELHEQFRELQQPAT
jgi:O-antigen/teichoic acid export membrane protein